MKQAIIKLSFRQHIDAAMEGEWERAISNASYDEFLLKSQAYNIDHKFTTFGQMVANDGRANSPHYKCGFPISPYINMLQNKIPGFTDNMGNPVKFEICQFALTDSDITERYAHRFSLTYITSGITLIDTVGDYLVLAYGNKMEDLLAQPPKPVDTFMIKVMSDLSIISYMGNQEK